jgi:uncharacterized protein YndB with AHSA1/START domain
MKASDRVRVSTFVAIEPVAAFEIFTAEIDRWWRRSPRFRGATEGGVMRFEGQAGGCLVEVDERAGSRFEIGRVHIWEPGKRLVFGFRARNFAEGEETEVEVRFEPARGGTSLVLEHRGFGALPATHPVRRGLDGEAFEAMIGYYWAELLTTYRAQCSGLLASGAAAR